MPEVKHIWNLVFNREALVKEAAIEFSQIRGGLPVEEGKPQARNQVNETWTALSQSFKLIFLTTIVAVCTALATQNFVHIPSGISSGLQYLGTLIMIWATLGKAGWQIQTFEGNTLTERLNDTIFRGLYVVGTFALVFG